MNAICAGSQRPKGVCNGESAVVVAMPIDANLFTAGLNDFVNDELTQSERPLRGRVANRITQHYRPCPVTSRRRIEPLDGFRIGANRILSDVHRGQAVVDRKLYGVFGRAFEMINGPIFDKPSNGARPE